MPPNRRHTFAAIFAEAPSSITGFSSCSVPSPTLTLTTIASIEPVVSTSPQLLSSTPMPTPKPGMLALASAMIDSPSFGSFELSRPTAQPKPKPTSKQTAQPSSVLQRVAPPPTPS